VPPKIPSRSVAPDMAAGYDGARVVLGSATGSRLRWAA